MKRINILILFVLITLCLPQNAFSQERKMDINSMTRQDVMDMSNEQLMELPLEDLIQLASKLSMSMDELLNMKVSVSSKLALTPREAPGIITVITQEEMQKSGARDLIDVLRLVPGINFGYDIDGAIGIGMRGNWGHEGKVLMLIDGLEVNENMYSSLQFGNHYSIDQIKTIEIIRGPGSSIYGGYAELGVINIITKNGRDLDGLEANASFGSMYESGTTARKNVGLNFGKKINDLEVKLLTHIGGGNMSDKKKHATFYGDTYNMGDGWTEYKTANVNFGASYKRLDVNFLYDNYDPNTTTYSKGVSNRFESLLGSIGYTLKLSDKFSLKPEFNISKHTPWHLNTTEYTEYAYHRTVARYKGDVGFSYDITPDINLLGGVSHFIDAAEDLSNDDETVFGNGKKTMENNTTSLYLQGLVKTKFANITLGGRYDKHDQFGSAFAPRIGLTKIFNNFHMKLLASRAFRSPSIENINITPSIEPEKTNVFEMEVGYQINRNMFFTANIFDITVQDPIAYRWDEINDEEVYANFDQSGTRGLELEYRAVYTKANATLNYSYYSAAGKNKVDYYSVWDENGDAMDNVLLAAPQHKLTLTGSIDLFKGLSLSPSLIYMGKRYGFTGIDANEESVQSKVDPTMLANVFLRYKDFLTKGLTVGIGMYDIFNSNYEYLQPYDGYEAPFPATSSEVMVKISYNLNFQ